MTRRANPTDLPPVDVQIPQWPAVVRARRRLEAVRSVTGRVATLAGAAAAAVGLFTPALTGWSLLADAALTLSGLATLRLWRPDGHQKATASVLYLVPGVTLAALLAVEHFTPGIHPVATPVEAGALLVWTVGVWVARPADAGRRMLTPPLPAQSAELAPVEAEVLSDHPVALWWAQNVAVKGGAAPSTVLDDIQRTGEQSMRAVIRSAVAGRPVPDVSIKHLSALMDIPEEEIAIGPVPGRGAGVRRLTIGKAEDDDLAAVWTKRIAPVAMPGAVLTGVRVGRPNAGHTTKEEL